MTWRVMMATIILGGSLLLGCAEENPAPSAPREEYSRAPAGPIRDHETGSSPDIRFYHDEESFIAARGEVWGDRFHEIPFPGSSCCTDCADSGLVELPHDVMIADRVRGTDGDACIRTEARDGSDRPAFIIEPPGSLHVFFFIRGILLEFEGELHGSVRLAEGSTVGFVATAPGGNTGLLGFGSDVDIASVRFTQTAVLRSILIDPGTEEREEAVVENMKLIADGFEKFAELAAGRYPTLATSATCFEGKSLKRLLPGRRYPINPYSGVETHFSWASGPCCGPGDCAAGTAMPGKYVIIAQGADSGPLPVEIHPPPEPDRVLRNMRGIQIVLERFAELNNGIYPTSPSDTTAIYGATFIDLSCETYPYNPYTFDEDGGGGEPTPVTWNADAIHESGAIAILEVTPDYYLIRGRGDDPDTYLDEMLTPDD